MDAAETLLAVMWIGLTLYVLLGGADFGGGFWDLFAVRGARGRRERQLIEHAIGPVWEANHVWLIFVIVLLWTGFPLVFASVMSTLYIPLTFAAIGIIARGAAFAFRKVSTEKWQQRLFGATFAAASVLTPLSMGAVAGGIASGRVPSGLAEGDLITSWINPTSALGGVLAVGVCAYLAAVYLCHEAIRANDPEVADQFRLRALTIGLAVGAVALGGIAILHADSPELFDGLTHRGLLLVIISAVAGLASLGLLLFRRYVLVRITGAAAVAAVLWGWATAQYPDLLVSDLSISEAAAEPAVLTATLISLAIGAMLLIPSLLWLFVIFQREHRPHQTPEG